MREFTQAELIELGKKRAAQMEKEAKRTKAVAAAVAGLKAKYSKEFDSLYKAALKDVDL